MLNIPDFLPKGVQHCCDAFEAQQGSLGQIRKANMSKDIYANVDISAHQEVIQGLHIGAPYHSLCCP